MEEKNISIKKQGGKIFLNGEEIDILSIFSYTNGESRELTLWKEFLYTNDLDRFVLDVIYALQHLVTEDNREEFKHINILLNLDFNEFAERLTERFVSRQEATRVNLPMENQEEQERSNL